MQNQSNNNVSVKFTYNNEIRRFTLTSERKTLTDLQETIRSLIKLDNDKILTFKYLDDESEWITIDKDIELECALSLCGSLLRINVFDAEDTHCETPWKKRGGGRCGRRGGKRGWKRNADDDAETESDLIEKECNDSGRCGRWKGRGRGRGRFERKFLEESESTSETKSVDPTLSLEQIKTQIAALVDAKKVLVAQMKEVGSKLSQKREEIKECKQNTDCQGERIAVLRAEMFELKTEKCNFRKAVGETQGEIRALRMLAKNKN